MVDIMGLDVIRAQLISNFKTGNVLLDTLIASIVISFLSYLLKRIDYTAIFEKLSVYIPYFTKRKVIKIKSYYKGSYKQFFPTEFVAIVEDLRERKIDVKEKVTISTQQDDVLLLPISDKPVKVKENIMFKVTQRDSEEYFDQDKERSVIRQIWIIELSSDLSLECIEDYIEEALEKYEDYKKSLVSKKYIYKFKKVWEDDDAIDFSKTEFETYRDFKTVFFEQKDKFLKYLSFFENNVQWFIDKQCPRHLGILLYGEPGCGKTSFIKALVNHTERSVVTINLSKVKSLTELESCFYKPYGHDTYKDCVFVIEDIDCMTDIVLDRKLQQKPKEVENFDKDDAKVDSFTLSHLLNLIDGLVEMPGRILIMTTNYVDNLDKALIRPGRIDFKIEMKKASRNVICQIISQYYDVNEEVIRHNSFFEQLEDNILTPAEVSDLIKNSFFSEKSVTECLQELINI